MRNFCFCYFLLGRFWNHFFFKKMTIGMEILAHQTSGIKTELKVVISSNLDVFPVNICVFIGFDNFLIDTK